MSNIDQYGIKMQFNNREFNSAIDESDQKVQHFEGTLLSLPSEIGAGISNLLSRVNLGDILGIAGVISGIGLIKTGFTSIVGVVENVTSTISSLFSSAFQTITQGGMERALNMEQARFQLKGLQLDTEMFLRAADYAVSGTAYGLDAAAKAASQMGAAGITAEDDLKAALRGISGVAAMTNSSYEEISQIFTSAAGMGRVTNLLLDRINWKGLGATQTLAKYLHVTESEVKEMAKNGEIDFMTFAKAMDDAFGEHAKDANQTYAGSLDNINAALRRLGEAFASSYIDGMIDVFNAVRLALNAFKSELGERGVFDSFGDTVKTITNDIADFIDKITSALNKSEIMDEIASSAIFIFDLFKKIGDTLLYTNYSGFFVQIGNDIANLGAAVRSVFEQIVDAFDKVFNIEGIGGTLKSLTLWFFNTLSDASRIFTKSSGLTDVFYTWFDTLKKIFGVFQDILGINRENISNLFIGVVQKAYDFLSALKLTDEETDKIIRTFSGLASVVDIVKMFAQEFLKFISPAEGLIRPIIDDVLTITASIGDWLTNLRKLIKEERVFEEFFQKVADLLVKIKDLAEKIGLAFKDAFFDVKNGTFFEKIGDFIKNIIETITNVISDLSPNDNGQGNAWTESIKTFLTNFLGIFDNVHINIKITDVIDWICKAFEWAGKLVDTIKEFLDKIGVVDIISFVFDSYKKGIVLFLVMLKYIGEKIIDFFANKALSDLDKGAITTVVLAIITAIRDIVVAIAGAIPELAYAISKIVKYGSKSGIWDGIGFAIKKISEIAKILAEHSPAALISKVLYQVSDIVRTANRAQVERYKDHASDVIGAFAKLIWAIAGGLFIIALIPVDKLMTALTSMVICLSIVGGIVIVLTLLDRLVKGDVSSMGRLRMGSRDLFKISKMDISGDKRGWMQFGEGFAFDKVSSSLTKVASLFNAIALAILAMSASVYIISKSGDTLEEIAFAVGMTAALLLLISTIVGVAAIATKKMGSIDEGSMLSMGGAILMIGGAMVLISFAIENLVNTTRNSSISTTDIAVVATTIALFAIFISGISLLGGLATTFNEMAWTGILAVGGAAYLIGAALAIVCFTMEGLIKRFSKIGDKETIDKTFDLIQLIVIGFGSIVAALAVIGAIAGFLGETGAIGLLAMAVLIATVAVAFASLALPIMAAVKGLEAASVFMESLKDIINTVNDLSDVEADDLSDKLTTILSAFPKAFFKGVFNEDTFDALKEGIPLFIDFLKNTLAPALIEYIKIMVPVVGAVIAESISTWYGLFSSTNGEQINQVLEFITNLYVQVVDTIWNLLLLGLDALIEKVPSLYGKLFTLWMTAMKTWNEIIEENKEELTKEISQLVYSLVVVMLTALTDERTVSAIEIAVNALIETFMDNVIKKLEDVAEFMRAVAAFIWTSFINELRSFGQYDTSGAWDELMAGYEDPIITPTVDLSKVRDANAELKDLMKDNTYDVSGVYSANAYPSSAKETEDWNYKTLLNGLGEAVGGISSIKDIGKDFNIKLEFEPNDWGTMKIMDEYSNMMTQAGYGGFEYDY